MKGLNEFLVPYTISQILAIAILITAFKSTKSARILFALLFFLACCMNMYLGIFAPDTYLDYAKFALPFYRDFINGWFSHYNQIIIPAIACGQLLIAGGMLLKGWWVKWACIGSFIFLMSISPLMVASAFPFSLIVSAAALIILKKDNRGFVWLKKKHPGGNLLKIHYAPHCSIHTYSFTWLYSFYGFRKSLWIRQSSAA